MKQSRLASFMESCGNTLSGFFISLGCQFGFLVWLKGLPMTWQDNFEFAVFMTFVSVARSFGWRRLMEALHVRTRLSIAMIAVAAERARQVTVEAFDSAHDDAHADGELALAGAAYIIHAAMARTSKYPPACWPWVRKWWKPQGFWRDMVRGCALIIAEMDRALRLRRDRSVSRIAPPASRAVGSSSLTPAPRSYIARGAKQLKPAVSEGVTKC